MNGATRDFLHVHEIIMKYVFYRHIQYSKNGICILRFVWSI